MVKPFDVLLEASKNVFLENTAKAYGVVEYSTSSCSMMLEVH